MYFQALVDGLLLGGVYAAIGLGLSLAYGVMGVVNWAHGEFLMVSMFISYYSVKLLGFNPYLTAIINIVVMAALGFVLQKYVFNKLVNRGNNAWRDILLFTAGASMLLQALFNMLFGAEVKALTSSDVGSLSGMLKLGSLFISKPKLISFLIAAFFCVVLYFFIQRSEAGRSLRATSQDRNTAQLMGINADLVYCLCFALSLGLVGLSGALLSPFYPVTPYVGSSFCFKSFIIVALGGRGNIPGAMLAGVLIGIIEKVGAVFLSDAYAQIAIFVLFIIILLVKPDGLLVRRKKA